MTGIINLVLRVRTSRKRAFTQLLLQMTIVREGRCRIQLLLKMNISRNKKGAA